MSLLAQMQPAAPADVGIWLGVFGAMVVIIGGCLWIATSVKTLLKKSEPPDPEKEFVTREEMSRTVDELEKRIDSFRQELTNKMDKLAEYQRTTAHDNANTLNKMALKLERLLTIREMDGALKLPAIGAQHND